MTDPYAPAALRAPDRPPARPAPRAAVDPTADPVTLEAVRPEVRALLLQSEAFQKLPPDEQRDLARKMVRVSAYMANPDGLAAQELAPDGGVLAKAQAGTKKTSGVTDAKKRASSNQGFAGEDFVAGATEAGVEQFGELVDKVDFPAFVSGLIQNVFQAIVDSSMQQMRAYGELLANVAKSVDEFAQDNISTNNARDWLTDRYPDDLDVGEPQASFSFSDDPFSDGQAEAQPMLQVTSDDAAAFLARVSEEMGLAEPVTDLSDAAQEARLARAAQLQIARSRQQLLASMVMLGINRIVVTDGQINAKVVFGMRASDTARRASKASLYDRNQSKTKSSAVAAGFWGWGAGAGSASASTNHVTTVRSSLDETSESGAEVKAKLSGEVRVNFKSDFLPMEKMATPEMMAAIQGRAQPTEPPVEGA